MNSSELQNYKSLIDDIKGLIHQRRYDVIKRINFETIDLYWEIGKEIYTRQKEKAWGKSVVEVLAKELQKEFPGAKGYSAGNLWRMRTFYLNYCASERLAPLVREISWSNNVVIMEKCKDDLEREFYIQMTKRYGWTKRILTNFIEAKSYEKYLSNQNNFDLTLPEERKSQARLALKDEYTFDFADLSPEYTEHELEIQLVNNVRAFLIEMGGDFTFVGNQYYLKAGTKDLFIDLLLFHRRFKKGDMVVPAIYDQAFGHGNGLCSVGVKSGKKQDRFGNDTDAFKYGFCDTQGNMVVPMEFDDVSIFENGVAYAIKDRTLYILKAHERPEYVYDEADKGEGLVVRRYDSAFIPAGTMTRGDVAVILHRLFKKLW